MNKHIDFGEKVRPALESGQAVVALESTIFTHGLPRPLNLEVARKAEQAVRDAGATPATIAIVDGRLKVGLSGRELQRLAGTGSDAVKCSRRDIPLLVQSRASAGTTVAATMIIAAMAGIRVFATGGIGGVHRGAGQSFDVSADLQELARTDVAVVCAGPKAILDIGLTLEYLETHGVPVLGYQAGELPAFYTRHSGFNVDYRLDTAAEIASALEAKWSLGLAGGVVIANPIPAEQALDGARVERWIGQAIREADEQAIGGKALTPFLLQRVEELSGGDSLQANVALVLNNARLAAEIAVAMSG